MEKVVETRICKHCSSKFDITDKDLEFYEKISPVFQRPVSGKETGLNGENTPLDGGGTKGGVIDLGNGKIKYLIPPPTLCPECRQQRRLIERNARKLYKRNCDASGKSIISMYSPDKPYKVYEQGFWWTDNWEALDYGPENGIDFSKGFFEQFKILKKQTPLFSLFTTAGTMENSEYTNCTGYLKNCYLISESDHNEDCYYSNLLKNNNNLIDCSIGYNNEHCYECIDCIGCFNLKYSQNSEICHDSFFLKDCVGCKDCIGCTNLREKQYMIFNIQHSKEDYEAKKIAFRLENYSGLLKIKEIYNTNVSKSICKNVCGSGNIDCIGDQIYNSKNAHFCFDSKDLEDCKYCLKLSNKVKSCMDFTSWGDKAEKIYYSSSCGDNIYNMLFCVACTSNLSNCFYCEQCSSLKNCFGCIGLRNKEYCILNKQYTKEEYEKIVPKIIEHMMKNREWGEFFPNDIAVFGYNETIAMDFFPLTKEEAIKKGFHWSDYESPFPKVEKIIPASKLPQDIKEIPDDILNWAIECEITKKPFRIIKQELEFYRKHNLPIPRRHPDQRHLDRMSLRNPRKLFARICDCPNCEENHKNIGKYKEEEFEINKRTGKKGKRLQTTYAPEREEIVYCEECYNKEVY